MAIIISGDLEAPTSILLVRTRIKTSARMAIYVICARNWVKPTADVGAQILIHGSTRTEAGCTVVAFP